MKVLLDTSIAIDLLRGDRPAVAQAFLALKPRDVRISAIAVAELRAGADLCRDPVEGHRRIDILLADVVEMPFDGEAPALSVPSPRICTDGRSPAMSMSTTS